MSCYGRAAVQLNVALRNVDRSHTVHVEQTTTQLANPNVANRAAPADWYEVCECPVACIYAERACVASKVFDRDTQDTQDTLGSQ